MGFAEALGAVSAPPTLRNVRSRGVTSEVVVSGDVADVTMPVVLPGVDPESAAFDLLVGKGLNPDDWVVSGVRSSEWTMPGGDIGTSVKYSFARKGTPSSTVPYPIDEVVASIGAAGVDGLRVGAPGSANVALIFALGDMQFGKVDGDGVDGTVRRCLEYVDAAAASIGGRLARAGGAGTVDVVIAFMGDHGEGFVSQGGANVFRTVLTNSEQMRITRRVMLHAVTRIVGEVARVQGKNPAAPKVTVSAVAVPGNHGDTVRIAGKGVTRYDDSWDTEALIQVADAVALSSDEALGAVKFFTPACDEIAVVLERGGSRVAFAHGHYHKPGKALDWLQGQGFNRESPLRDVDLLIEGHLHHFHVDTRSGVWFVGCPAVESESTWFRHRTGVTGEPGSILVEVSGGSVRNVEVIS